MPLNSVLWSDLQSQKVVDAYSWRRGKKRGKTMWGPTFYLTSFSQPGPAGTTHLHPAAERRKRYTRMPSTQQNKRKTLRRCNFFCCVSFPSQNLPQQSPLELRTRTFQKPTAREEAKNKPKAKNFEKPTPDRDTIKRKENHVAFYLFLLT